MDGSHAGHLASEEALREFAERLGVPGGEELVVGRAGGGAFRAATHELGVHVLGGLLGGGHEHHVLAKLELQQTGQQRIVGAAQNHRVDALPS